ncbi:hypothetical protein GQ600_26321 [Phytophthora cactorum]|nr:hypothetical protein GQ600_26321 [Phytophthora cactorum]
MLTTVKNMGHNAPIVTKVIENGFKTKYDIEIREMTRFMMSNTTPSAKNEDCSMHLLNLCIGYLNNHFKSHKQRNALKKIQEALSYPELEPMTDKDVRVAYTCKLIHRAVVNYAACEAYFQPMKNSTSAWTVLTAKDWMLAVEMEAVTFFIASLALVEAQSENLVSSCMVVFRRLAEKKPKSFKFKVMATEAPRVKDETKQVNTGLYGRWTNYLPLARHEHRQVFAQMAKQDNIPLSQPPSSQSSLLSQESTSPLSSLSSTGWDEEDELLLEAPIRTSNTNDEVKESEIKARANVVMKEWLGLEPEWLEYFRDEGEVQLPSSTLLARIHVGKISSSAFHGRVFSTGGIVMGPLRTRTESRRAEKQLLLRHNGDDIVKMKQDVRKEVES